MITLTFTQDQLTMLGTAIAELPHKHAVPLIQTINAPVSPRMTKADPNSKPIDECSL